MTSRQCKVYSCPNQGHAKLTLFITWVNNLNLSCAQDFHEALQNLKKYSNQSWIFKTSPVSNIFFNT